MDGIGGNLEILRPQLLACLGGALPGPAAQRLFAPDLAYGRHAGPPALGARQEFVMAGGPPSRTFVYTIPTEGAPCW